MPRPGVHARHLLLLLLLLCPLPLILLLLLLLHSHLSHAAGLNLHGLTASWLSRSKRAKSVILASSSFSSSVGCLKDGSICVSASISQVLDIPCSTLAYDTLWQPAISFNL